MKKEASKKSKLWLWLTIGIVALLAVASVVVAMVMLGGQGQTTPDRPELYWNLDQAVYITDGALSSSREKAEDGFFHIRFAYNGDTVELLSADKQLVNFIDTMSVMGLVLDDDGYIVDALPAKEVATVIKEDVYVQDTGTDSIIINSSVVMNGMKTEIPLSDKTEIYNVTAGAEVPGSVITLDQLQTMDKLSIYANEYDEVTHVFVTGQARASKVYWRANQFTSSGKTTRVPDANGYYTIPFYCEGEYVELKCKDEVEVSYIDKQSRYSAHFGLVFDEDGYITEAIHSYEAIRGTIRSERFDVTGISGDQISTTKVIGSNIGTTDAFTLPQGVPIYDVSPAAKSEDRMGKTVDSLQLGDRIVCFADPNGDPLFVYVAERVVEDAIWCYSLGRKYDTTLKETTREPDANGWYVFEVFSGGQVLKVRTKDRAVATEVDSFGDLCFGLTLNGDEITEVYTVTSVFGYGAFGQGRYITDITGSIFTCIRSSAPDKAVTGILGVDCKIYNLSEVGTYGEQTTLQKGDYIYAYQNPSLQVVEIFVMRRMVDAPIYYSLSRKYDAQNKVTTREPDENGWYVYDVAVNGKRTTVKTKSKAMATKMDAFSPAAMTLVVGSDGVVYEAYSGQVSTGGYRRASGYKVVSINDDGTVDTVYEKSGATRKLTLADYTKVYNVSQIFSKNRGEATSLRVGDIITSFNDIYDKAAVIFVRTRYGGSLHWNTQRMYDDDKKVSTRVPDAAGWYVYQLAVDGEIKTYKTQDKAIADQVDYYGGAFVINSYDGVITGVASPSYAKDSCGTNFLNYDVMKIEGNKVTLQFHSEGSAKDGETQVITLSSKAKIYDVSPTAEKFGAPVELKVGDRVRTYKARYGESYTYVFIRFRDTHKGGADGYCDVCKENVYWVPWMGGSFSASGGHFYLNASMETETLPCSTGRSKTYPSCTVCLDLNGNTYNRTKGRAMYVYENATLNILDSVGGGAVLSYGIEKGTSGGVIGIVGGTVNLYSGTLQLTDNHATQERGGVVYLGLGGSEKKAPGVFNMYGGTITGGEVTDRGGNICISGGTFNLYDGSIADGWAGSRGGNIVTMGNGTFNQYGGTVSGGYTDGSGGNIYGGTGFISIAGGSVKDGTAVTGGGNIYMLENLTISGGTISGGTATTKSGGNIYVSNYSEKTAMTITGGTITDGKCDGYGGNIYCEVSPKISNATIQNGTAVKNGGNIYCAKDTVLVNTTVSGGKAPNGGNIYGGRNWQITKSTIQDGIATDEKGSGGNIYASSGEWVLEESTISGGRSGARGGNLFVSTAVITMNSGSITGGQSGTGNANGGGNVCTVSNGAFKLYGGSVTDGISLNTGGNILSGSGALEIYGGTVSGGTAPTAGSDIYVYGGATDVILAGGELGNTNISAVNTMQLAGQPKIEALVMGSGVLANVEALEKGAAIGLIAEGTFTLPLDKPDKYEKHFTPLEEGYSLYVEGDALALGAGIREVYCSHCDKTVPQKLWLGKTGNGHYYLDSDAVTDSALTVEAETDMVLDLCGNTLRGENTYVFQVNGNLAVLDSQSGGEIVGAGTGRGGVIRVSSGSLELLSGTLRYAAEAAGASHGGVLYMDTGATANLIGGTVCDGKSLERGGNIYVNSDSILNLSGATVTGGQSGTGNSNGGGNIFVLGGGLVNMTGGAVTNGISQNTAGNILVGSGTLIVTGGEISGGSAASMADNIYVYYNLGSADISGGEIESITYTDAESFILSGAPKIGKMEIASGKLVTIGQLSEGADVAFVAEGTFGTSTEDLRSYVEKGWLRMADSKKGLAVEDGMLSVGEKLLGAKDAYCSHCDSQVTWYLWNGTSTNGHFYLNSEVSLDETFTIPTGCDLVVDLAGNVMSNSTGQLFTLNGKLSVMDSAAGGAMVGAGTGNGGVISISGGTLDMYSGTLRYAQEADGANRGGVLYLDKSATVNLMGGTVCDGRSTERGGNIFVAGTSTLNLSGATVTGGQSGTGNSNGGGNIFVLGNGLVNMTGGAVTNGISQNTAGNILVGTGTLRVSGGEISGGSAAGKAPNIYVYFGASNAEITGGKIESITYTDANSLAISGGPQIQQLYIAAGKLVTLGDLTADASILVDATGAFTTAHANAQAYVDGAQIQSAVTTRFLEVVDGQIVSSEVPADIVNAYCEHCGEEVTWRGWNGVSADGHFYATDDLSLTGTVEIPAGSSLTLDLKGKKVENTSGLVFNLTGALVVLDTVGGGRIEGAGTGNGGVIYAENGTLDLYSGTLAYYQDAAGTNFGGVLYLRKSTANLRGGIVENGKCKDRGGNIYQTGSTLNLSGTTVQNGTSGTASSYGGGNIASVGSSILNMTGGKLLNGTAGNNGGNLLAGSGTITISGGEITGGSAPEGADVMVYLNSGSTVTVTGGTFDSLSVAKTANKILTVSGNPIIGKLDILSGLTVNLGVLTDGADITVDAEGIFTETNTEAAAYVANGWIKAIPGKEITVTDDKLSMAIPADAGCPHCGLDVTWTAWNGETDTGHYYLAADYSQEVTYGVAIPEDSTVVIDLRGKSILGDRVRAFDNNGNLFIMDTVGGGEVVTGGNPDKDSLGGVVRVRKGTFTLMGGTLRLADDHSATIKRGGVIYIDKTGSVVIKDGTVMNGVTTERGGNIFLASGGATLTVEGGLIKDGTAGSGNSNGGGNIAVLSSSTVDIRGGTVSGGQSPVTAGNILATGNLVISGGEIYGGTATGIAQNIYVLTSAGIVTVTGGSIQDLTTASTCGGATISGNPVISEMNLLDGFVLTLGQLTTGADVTVSANDGVFTTANAEAATYVAEGWLKPASGKEIREDGGILSMAAVTLAHRFAGFLGFLTKAF